MRAPSAAAALLGGNTGYPALYGRFTGANRPAAMPPPANTLALNPYSRPTSTVRPGEIPNGAQLLTAVRQAPGGGSDLYASPDGNIYRRKDDGWYRRQAGGKWSYFAPTQGRIEREQVAAARGGQASGAGAVYRPVAGANAGAAQRQALRNRVPDTGFEARDREVKALEREYYARSLAQVRARNSRPSVNYSRPARAGGRRR
jgi:hypothetical protein